MNQIQTQDMAEQLPQIKLWNGQRVVTFKDIDEVHQRKAGTARNSFKNNKKHFIKNVDYYLITREDFNGRNSSNGQNLPIENIPPKGITVFTESGYLMIVKSFKDDLSWEVQRRLVNSYFQKQEQFSQTELPQKEKEQYLLKDSQTWFSKNNWKMQILCRDFRWERKYLYHKILTELSDIYNLKGIEKEYVQKNGHAPVYKMELVEFYEPLQGVASRYLDYLLEC